MSYTCSVCGTDLKKPYKHTFIQSVSALDWKDYNKKEKENYFNESIKLFYGFLFDDVFINGSFTKKTFLSANLISIFISKYLSLNYDHKKFLEFIEALCKSCWKLHCSKVLGLKILIKG